MIRFISSIFSYARNIIVLHLKANWKYAYEISILLTILLYFLLVAMHFITP